MNDNRLEGEHGLKGFKGDLIQPKIMKGVAWISGGAFSLTRYNKVYIIIS
jgi:hypothetical protein